MKKLRLAEDPKAIPTQVMVHPTLKETMLQSETQEAEFEDDLLSLSREKGYRKVALNIVAPRTFSAEGFEGT